MNDVLFWSAIIAIVFLAISFGLAVGLSRDKGVRAVASGRDDLGRAA